MKQATLLALVSALAMAQNRENIMRFRSAHDNKFRRHTPERGNVLLRAFGSDINTDGEQAEFSFQNSNRADDSGIKR